MGSGMTGVTTTVAAATTAANGPLHRRVLLCQYITVCHFIKDELVEGLAGSVKCTRTSVGHLANHPSINPSTNPDYRTRGCIGSHVPRNQQLDKRESSGT